MKKYRALAILFSLMFILAGCKAVAPTPLPTPTAVPPTATPAVPEPGAPAAAALVSPVGLDGALVKGTNGQPWWNDAIFYEVFVRSFYDSNGDGVGDINGLIEKLDYLNDGDPATTSDLGVTGLWLMPVAQSPSYHGYDVVDYRAIDDEYGTTEDFKRLMAEAHDRGIHIIVDLVMNHTSSEHPWFIEAQDPASPKRDWYIWSETDPQADHWHAGVGGWYYGYFWEGMPDLNYNNPAVTAEMNDIVRFWLVEMGVDGFRLDALKHLFEDGAKLEHAPATFAWLKDFHTLYKGLNADAFAVGEVWAESDLTAQYVGDKVDVVFEFSLAEATIKSALLGKRADVLKAQQKVVELNAPGQYATFLANHDQNRVRSQVFNDEQLRSTAALQLLFPGIPFIYYGEEIGMRGQKPDEDIRRPLQWTAEGGFTAGTPWRDYYEDLAERNIAGQDADPASLLNHYRNLVRVRNEHEALRVGDWQPVEVQGDSGELYAALRSTPGETILVLINLSNKPVTGYTLQLAASPLTQSARPALLLGAATTVAAPTLNAGGGFENYAPLATLEARTTYLFQWTP